MTPNLILILAVTCSIYLFAGCASTETSKNDKSLLSAAGFHVMTPKTAEEQKIYAALPSNKVERARVKGEVFYVFKDDKAGVAYIGGESEHRRYQQLCMKQQAKAAQEEQMNPSLAVSWNNHWGPRHDPALWR